VDMLGVGFLVLAAVDHYRSRRTTAPVRLRDHLVDFILFLIAKVSVTTRKRWSASGYA